VSSCQPETPSGQLAPPPRQLALQTSTPGPPGAAAGPDSALPKASHKNTSPSRAPPPSLCSGLPSETVPEAGRPSEGAPAPGCLLPVAGLGDASPGEPKAALHPGGPALGQVQSTWTGKGPAGCRGGEGEEGRRDRRGRRSDKGSDKGGVREKGEGPGGERGSARRGQQRRMGPSRGAASTTGASWRCA